MKRSSRSGGGRTAPAGSGWSMGAGVCARWRRIARPARAGSGQLGPREVGHGVVGANSPAAARFDAGIRPGERVVRDMIAVRISDDMPLAVAASPAYVARRGTPGTPPELTSHA